MNHKASKLAYALVTVAILIVLGLLLMLFINPEKQSKKNRNARREDDVKELIQLMDIYMKDNQGQLPGQIPATPTLIGSAEGQINICSALIPRYTKALPYDKSLPGSFFENCERFNLGYTISLDANNKITIEAPAAELGTAIETQSN